MLNAVDAALRASGVKVPARRAIPSYAMMPVREYLERVHAAGALVGPTPEEGIARLHARAASFLLDQPVFRMFVTPRDREPLHLLERLERSRAMVASYGRWRVHGVRGDVTITIADEWVWIGPMWCSLIRSVFPACRAPEPLIERTGADPWSATVRVRW